MAQTVLTRYQHKPLRDQKQEIRVVIVQPGKQADELSCKIQTVSEWENGEFQYHALSYVWGPQDDLYNLPCEGHFLPIGQNLKSALLRLRSEDGACVLWIDQICIDQSNPAEQGAQVNLMAKIYSSASKVVVWLGEEDEETASALDLITSVAHTFWLDLFEEGIDNTVRYEAMEQRVLKATDVWTEFGLPAKDNLAWKAVDNLLNRPWFTRAWTYQEIIVAGDGAELACGSHQMSWWGTFFIFSTSMSKLSSVLKQREAKSRPPTFLRQIEYLRQITLARSQYSLMGKDDALSKKLLEQAIVPMSLSFQLQDRRESQATNPRDKVFSLLNIVYDNPYFSANNEFKSLFPQPDYEVPLQQVYTNAARYCLYTDGHLGMLYDVECPKHDTSFPSWVPDWRVSWLSTIRGSHNRLGTAFSAAVGLSPVFWHESHNNENASSFAITDEDDSILRVLGMRLSIVESIEPELTVDYLNSAGQTVSKMGPNFWRILKLCGDLALDEGQPNWPKYSFVPGLTTAFTSVLSEDDALTFISLLERLKDHWSPMNLILRQHDPYYAADADQQIEDLAASLAQHLKEVRIFETNHEDLCIGPKTIEIGDHVSVLLGGPKPFVLRQTSDSPPTYTLVGECYTPRLIKGEGIRVKLDVVEAVLAENPEMSDEDWTQRVKEDPMIVIGMERLRIV